FALAIANAFRMRNAKPPIEPASPEPMLINFRERDHFPHESFYAALEAASKNDLAYLKSKFGGRIVLIAFLGEQGDEDLTSTPHYYWRTGAAAGTSRRKPGIEIHANTIATLLNDDPIVPLETWKQNLVALAVVGLIALAGAVWPPLPSTIASAGILAFLF